MSKLFVDYTNHRGKRAWREIMIHTLPFVTIYPPNDADYDGPRSNTLCLSVFMADRDNKLRTLAFKSIHGFHYGPDKPDTFTKRSEKFAFDPLGFLEDRTADHESRLCKLEGIANLRPLPTPGDPVLTFQRLQIANAERQIEWDKDDKIKGDFGLLYRAVEYGGEGGELLNKIKKKVRENIGIAGSRTNDDEIGLEIGDCMICLALLANSLDLDLSYWTKQAFNRKSEQLGLKTRL